MKATIKDQVTAAAVELKELTSAKALYQWAIDHAMDNRSAFPKFKAALLTIGVDYAAIKAAGAEARAESLAATVTHSVTLYSDAKARTDRFAICDAKGRAVWFGKFFDDDADYRGEQSSGELSAAKKAIWLASKIRNEVCATGKTIHLKLIVDADWLCTLSGKAAQLAEAARKFNLELEMDWIAGTSNPADSWTTASGFQSYKDTDLTSLTDAAIAAEPTPQPKPAPVAAIAPAPIPAHVPAEPAPVTETGLIDGLDARGINPATDLIDEAADRLTLVSRDGTQSLTVRLSAFLATSKTYKAARNRGLYKTELAIA